MHPHGKRRCGRANGSVQKAELAAQTNHPRVLFLSFHPALPTKFLPQASVTEIPENGLDSAQYYSAGSTSTKYSAPGGVGKNHNAAEFSLVLFKTTRIFNWIFPVFSLGPLITPEACTPPPYPHLNEVMMEEITDGSFQAGFSREGPRWAPNARWKDYADPYVWCCGCVPPVGLNPICSRFGLEGAASRGGWVEAGLLLCSRSTVHSTSSISPRVAAKPPFRRPYFHLCALER